MNRMDWLVLGDFSETLCQQEKMGGGLYPRHQMEKFQDAANFYGLKIILNMGHYSVWNNRLVDGSNVKAHLDKGFLCGNAWPHLPRATI